MSHRSKANPISQGRDSKKRRQADAFFPAGSPVLRAALDEVERFGLTGQCSLDDRPLRLCDVWDANDPSFNMTDAFAASMIGDRFGEARP